MDIKSVHFLNGKKHKQTNNNNKSMKIVKKSNDTSDLQIFKERVYKNNNQWNNKKKFNL